MNQVGGVLPKKQLPKVQERISHIEITWGREGHFVQHVTAPDRDQINAVIRQLEHARDHFDCVT